MTPESKIKSSFDVLPFDDESLPFPPNDPQLGHLKLFQFRVHFADGVIDRQRPRIHFPKVAAVGRLEICLAVCPIADAAADRQRSRNRFLDVAAAGRLEINLTVCPIADAAAARQRPRI